MTKEEIFKDKVKEYSKKFNINSYEVYQKYMFERILERISVSNYRDNFILKGGLLLSAFMGIENRSTRDMDANIKGIDISKEKMTQVLNEILSIDIEDGVEFELIDVTNIKEDDEYGGNKYILYGRIGNTRIQLDIDISTGDIITPNELMYKYPLSFENRSILISTYNLSTIIAEKLQTILSRGKFNSRMKDYYDLYYFIKNMYNDINFKELKKAIKNTFEKRNSVDVLYDYNIILKDIADSISMNEKWIVYSRKNKYARNIEFKEILLSLIDFMNKMNLVIVIV